MRILFESKTLKQMDDALLNGSDENESHLHELESKRDSVYVPLELAKYQIKNVRNF